MIVPAFLNDLREIDMVPFILRKGNELKCGYHEVAPKEITEMVAFQKWNASRNKQHRVFFWSVSFAEKEKDYQ